MNENAFETEQLLTLTLTFFGKRIYFIFIMYENVSVCMCGWWLQKEQLL